ncbi:hypothetical protein BN946_scf184858.g57 [Trametes cinnabarina]|uniref:Uncharacterized protein n=1 Tax=Pycnoporus cinnabarinus TaxID=5643 RepID=A0A060SM61_PYCCI|nr:hypothetical protein BN946_scf184858.g57 [Trametes cinnabarina]
MQPNQRQPPPHQGSSGIDNTNFAAAILTLVTSAFMAGGIIYNHLYRTNFVPRAEDINHIANISTNWRAFLASVGAPGNSQREEFDRMAPGLYQHMERQLAMTDRAVVLLRMRLHDGDALHQSRIDAVRAINIASASAARMHDDFSISTSEYRAKYPPSGYYDNHTSFANPDARPIDANAVQHAINQWRDHRERIRGMLTSVLPPDIYNLLRLAYVCIQIAQNGLEATTHATLARAVFGPGQP